MQNYRNGKWADQILSQRREDGLWAQIVEKAFASGSYSVTDDIAAFTEWKGRKPKSGFET